MNEHLTKMVFKDMPLGYALHQFVTDENGKPCDYIFLDINPQFEEYIGLCSADIIGKEVTEVLPDIMEDDFDWIKTYAKVAYGGEKIQLEQYSYPLKRWYRVQAYSPQYGYFVTLFEDVSKNKKLETQMLEVQQVTKMQEILTSICNEGYSDQQVFLDRVLLRALDMTGSQYGYIYLYDEKKKEFKLISWTDDVMSECKITDKQTIYQLEKTGIWGEAVRQRKPIIVNDFQVPNPLKQVYPKGHAAFLNYLSIPVIHNEKIVAVVGLANKETGFTQFDTNQIIMLMQNAWLIKEAKQNSLKLAEGAKFLKTVFDCINVPVAVINAKDYTIAMANKAYGLVYDVQSVVGKKCYCISHRSDAPCDGENYPCSLLHIKESGRPFQVEHLHYDKNGELRNVEIHASPIFDHQGEVKQVVEYFVDITERRKIENETKRHQREITEIKNIGLLASSTLDIETVLNSILRCTTNLINASVGMIFIKDSISDLIKWGASLGLSEDFVNEFKKKPIQLGEGLTGTIAQTGEPIFIKEDSSYDPRIVRSIIQKEDLNSFLGVPIFAEDKIIGVMNILTRQPAILNEKDVNIISAISFHVGLAIRNAQLYKAQKEAYADLLESEEKFRQISENIDEVFWLRNADNSEIHYINPAYEKVWGRTCRSLYNNQQSFIDSVYDADKPVVFAEFEKYMSTGVFDLEYRIVRPDGEIRWVQAQSFPVLNHDGEVFRHTGIAVDITDRMILEEHLRMQRDSLKTSNKKLEHMLQQSINAISKIGELRDVYTAGHQKRVSMLACAIALELGLSDDDMLKIKFGALIHDIGKIYIPSDILNRPGQITNLEYQILQTHAEHSYDVVKEIDFPSQIPTMIYQHHERLDGRGYPQGLSGDQIILESRILAVADVVEAMTSHRPYRTALGIDAALKEIVEHKATKYDAEVVDVCIKLFREKGYIFPA